MLIADYAWENTQLESRNRELRGQIEELESSMLTMPIQKISFMEAIVPAARAVLKRPASLPKLTAVKLITRPKTASLLTRPFH
jgi:hypothetical protein